MIKHKPEDELFFNAIDVFEIVTNEYGQLELYPVLKDSIRPLVHSCSKKNVINRWDSDYAYCQVINGRVVQAFRKSEIAFVPKGVSDGSMV